MNDEQLRNELQSRIPEPNEDYWDSIDSRLAAIEQSQDFDHPATTTDARPGDNDGDDGVVRVLDVSSGPSKTESGSNGSRVRYLLTAAAVLAVLGLGAIVLSQRAARDTAGELDVATQPDTPSGLNDSSLEQVPTAGDAGSTASAGALSPSERACYQSQNPVVLDRAGADIVRPWPRVAIFGGGLDGAGFASLMSWENIPPEEAQVPHTVMTQVPFEQQVDPNHTFVVWEDGLDGFEELVYALEVGPSSLTIGNVTMDQVQCEQIQPAIDLLFRADPDQSLPVAEAMIDETPECYRSQATWVLDRVDADSRDRSAWPHRLAMVQFDQTGFGTLITWEDIPAGAAETRVVLSTVVSSRTKEPLTFEVWPVDAGAASVVYNVVRGNSTLTIGNVTMDRLPCEQIQPAIDLMFGADPAQRYSAVEVTPVLTETAPPSLTPPDVTPPPPPAVTPPPVEDVPAETPPPTTPVPGE